MVSYCSIFSIEPDIAGRADYNATLILKTTSRIKKYIFSNGDIFAKINSKRGNIRKVSSTFFPIICDIKFRSSSSENISGDVYIGSGETDAVPTIADAAKDFHGKYPLIRYHIYRGDAEHIVERLDKGLIDFGLLVEPFDMAKYDYIKLPMKDTWGVLMTANSPLAQKESICAENLWDKPLIISHQTASSGEMAAWLRKDLSQLNIVAFYDLLYNASRFVKSGFGYAIALDKLINTTGDRNLCFRPLSPVLEAGLCIVWKRYQVFSKAAEKFLKEIQVNFSTEL